MRFNRLKTKEGDPRQIIRLPLLGKIRLGIKKETAKGKEYPVETDYFVCPEEVQKVYGSEPKILPVFLPVEDESMFFSQYHACYGGNQKVKCMGDGEIAERRQDDGSKIEVECPSPQFCDFGIKKRCSTRVTLMVILPEVNMGGVYQITTGSINADIDIRSGIVMAKSVFGRISLVPMELARKEKIIPHPETGVMNTHWPVSLNPKATVEDVNALRADTERILTIQSGYQLPDPDIEGKRVENKVNTTLITELTPVSPQPEKQTKKNSTREKTSEALTALPDIGHSLSDFIKGMNALHELLGDNIYFVTMAEETGSEEAKQIRDRKSQISVFDVLLKKAHNRR